MQLQLTPVTPYEPISPPAIPYDLIAVGTFLFVLGFATGYVVALWTTAATMTHLRRGVALLVSLAWMASFAVGIVLPGYETPVHLHAAFGAMAGWLFAGEHGFSFLPTVQVQRRGEDP